MLSVGLIDGGALLSGLTPEAALKDVWSAELEFRSNYHRMGLFFRSHYRRSAMIWSTHRFWATCGSGFERCYVFGIRWHISTISPARWNCVIAGHDQPEL